MEISMISETEQVQLQRLTLHHAHIRHIGDVDCRKIRLSSNRTKTCEFRAVEFYEIIIVRMFVDKCLQNIRRIIRRIRYVLVSQQRNSFLFFLCSSHFYHLIIESFYLSGRNRSPAPSPFFLSIVPAPLHTRQAVPGICQPESPRLRHRSYNP